MGSEDFNVDPSQLDGPSKRLTVIGNQIGQLDNEVGTQVGAAKGAAGRPEVGAGLDVFRQGIAAALGNIDTDVCQFGTNVGTAQSTYVVTDKNAYNVTGLNPTS